MKSLTPLIFFFICSNLYAYQPKLMLLGALENKGESFIDVNAHQKFVIRLSKLLSMKNMPIL